MKFFALAKVIKSAYHKHHKYIIRNDFISVYWRGSFCLVEIDFRFGRKHTFQFLTNNGFYNHFTNPY